MTRLVIANLLTCVATIISLSSSFFKTKKQMLIVQSIECAINGVTRIIINSLSSSSQLFLCAIRNIIFSKFNNKYLCFLFSGLFLAIGLIANNQGILGLLPIFATIQYTLWSGFSKTAKQIRIGMIINYIPWIIHDFVVGLYVSAIVMIISAIIVIYNLIKNDPNS